MGKIWENTGKEGKTIGFPMFGKGRENHGFLEGNQGKTMCFQRANAGKKTVVFLNTRKNVVLRGKTYCLTIGFFRGKNP